MTMVRLFVLINFGITIPLFGCPLCIDRINELQEPFFAGTGKSIEKIDKTNREVFYE